MNFRSKSQRGFTLLEVLLAIGVSLSIGAVALTELRRDNESKQAKAVGQQSAMVGRALNTYLALQYTHIVNLDNSPGVGAADDPGPRFCTANVTTVNGNPASICTITTDTLVRSGLLPTSFSGRNAYGAEYDIYIRIVGTSPNWIVEGLVVTDQPYTTGGGNRYDLLGQAMQEAGADAGMTRTLANTMEGLNGTWRDNTWPSVTHDGVTYPGVNQLGLLGYRAGYGSSGYAAYLRLDGTTPMTGFLDMSGHDIANVGDLEAQTGTFNPALPTDAAISINNTTPNNRTDFVAGAATLGIRNNGGVRFESLDTSTGSNVSMGSLVTDANITANGDIGTNGNLGALGDLTVGGNATVGGYLRATGQIQGGSISTYNNGNITTDGTGQVSTYRLNASDAVNVAGYTIDNTGLFQTGGRPWFYNNSVQAWETTGGISASNTIRGGRLESAGDIQAEGKLHLRGSAPSGVATEGAACTAYGEIRRTNTTDAPVVTCISGAWRRMGGTNTTLVTSTVTANGGNVDGSATCPTGSRVIGGGYVLTNWPCPSCPGGMDSQSPIGSFMAGNGWTVRVGQTNRAGTSFQVQAVCAY